MRDVDNPFSPDYVLDAIGVTCGLYPNPRVWRPLMERLLADVTLGINKSYIRVNRFLADHQVLPEIKAQLRARSELRPPDDAELLPAFLRLFKERDRPPPTSCWRWGSRFPRRGPGEKARPRRLHVEPRCKDCDATCPPPAAPTPPRGRASRIGATAAPGASPRVRHGARTGAHQIPHRPRRR